MEYILLIGAGVLVAITILVIALTTTQQGQGILDNAIVDNVTIGDKIVEVESTPLTTISLIVCGGEGQVIIQYSAPGASSITLAQSESISSVTALQDSDAFATSMDPQIVFFPLPFFETQVASGGVVNGTTYHYRLLACKNETCFVSQVESTTPSAGATC